MKIQIKYLSFSSRALGQSFPFHCIQACFALTGSLSKKDPEKSKGSKAANADAEVIATEGAAAKGGYKNRKQNATKAADAKKQQDEPIVPPATEETPSPLPAVPDAAPPKNGEASAEGTPAETNTARPSAYRSRKQNQPAAAEKPAEGTPPTPPASEETPAPLPAVPDAATPKNGEASGEGAPADMTTARPSAYRSRKQNQSSSASSGPSAVALSPESLGNTADSGGRSSYRQRRQSAAAAKPETRPSANRSRTQDQYLG